MTQSLEGSTAHGAEASPTHPLIVTEDGKPLYALIDYELYLALQETIDEWYAGQRAAAAYDAWKQEPSRGRPWAEVEAELVDEGVFDE